MFSDEFRFSVTRDSLRQLLCRERGTRYAHKFVWERDRYGPSVMVWAGIMHIGLTPLHIFERGSVTSQQYFGEVHALVFRGVGTVFQFMDDNARLHRSVEVSVTLQSENLLRMQ
ncbi:transposable element Tc1 transposase [Trichonephila clavipes]|nr:transposable element Tc1 transposase [Trichonephila clavipes]